MTPPHDYPGGAAAPAYRVAFILWIIGFLTILVLAFSGYLGLKLTRG